MSELTSKLRHQVLTSNSVLMKDRLKQIREQLDKTQREMGALVGVHERAWQKYEKGANIPGGEVLQSLAKLGFNINWILTGEGEQLISQPHTYKNLFIEDISPLVSLQIQPVIDAVIEVMTSDHSGVKLALTQNALMFQEMVRNARQLEKLEKRVADIERETDFKTQGSPGKENAGGG